MATLSLYYTTFPSREEANKIIEKLLHNSLILCANSFSITSHYIWKERMSAGEEIACYFKINKEKALAFEDSLRELHPYDVPCFFEVSVSNKSSEFIASLEGR